MPIPIIAALAGTVVGRTTKKPKKQKTTQAVSKYTTKKGTKVKAYERGAR